MLSRFDTKSISRREFPLCITGPLDFLLHHFGKKLMIIIFSTSSSSPNTTLPIADYCIHENACYSVHCCSCAATGFPSFPRIAARLDICTFPSEWELSAAHIFLDLTNLSNSRYNAATQLISQKRTRLPNSTDKKALMYAAHPSEHNGYKAGLDLSICYQSLYFCGLLSYD